MIEHYLGTITYQDEKQKITTRAHIKIDELGFIEGEYSLKTKNETYLMKIIGSKEIHENETDLNFTIIPPNDEFVSIDYSVTKGSNDPDLSGSYEGSWRISFEEFLLDDEEEDHDLCSILFEFTRNEEDYIPAKVHLKRIYAKEEKN